MNRCATQRRTNLPDSVPNPGQSPRQVTKWIGDPRMSNRYAVVSGAIFAVVAVLQAARALNQWPMHVGTVEIPVWVSWIAMVVAGGLSVWGFRSRGR